MKRLITLLTLVCICVCAVPFSVVADTEGNYGDLTYTIKNEEVRITCCSRSVAGAIEIPAEIEGYPVTAIWDNAFMGCTKLESVTIPDSVQRIRFNAFSGCSQLREVKIGKGLKRIDSEAFLDCNSLEDVYIYDLRAWCNISFYHAIGRSFYSNPLVYADNLYLNGVLVTEVVIPDGIEIIHEHAFDCLNITSVVIPDSVKTIGDYAFLSCDLRRIYLPSSVTFIDEYAFHNAKNLKQVFYGGSESDSNSIRIFVANDALLNATWNYNATELPEHTYDNACDSECNKCGITRVVGDHTYGEYVYNNDATCDADGTKTATCTCGAKDTVTAVGTKIQNPFTDVKAGEYYAEPVLWAVGKGITNGTSATTFSPNAQCTRGQIVTFLWRAAGSPEPRSTRNPFTDVKRDQYYYKAVLWAVEKGITNGTSATTFSPNATCTRGQVVTFLWRAKGKPSATATTSFTDVKAGQYYTEAVAWAVKNNITTGMSATQFAPDATCTRGQIVTFLYRAYK